MKIFRGDSEYCSVFGVWHDGVRVERISQLGSSQSLKSKRNQFHMWCDREISLGIGSYSLRDVNLNLPIQIVSSELIAKVSKKKERDALIEYLYSLSAIELTPSTWYFESSKLTNELWEDIGERLSSDPHFYLFHLSARPVGIGNQEMNDRIKRWR